MRQGLRSENLIGSCESTVQVHLEFGLRIEQFAVFSSVVVYVYFLLSLHADLTVHTTIAMLSAKPTVGTKSR